VRRKLLLNNVVTYDCRITRYRTLSYSLQNSELADDTSAERNLYYDNGLVTFLTVSNQQDKTPAYEASSFSETSRGVYNYHFDVTVSLPF
jgi:hypothetical protein